MVQRAADARAGMVVQREGDGWRRPAPFPDAGVAAQPDAQRGRVSIRALRIRAAAIGPKPHTGGREERVAETMPAWRMHASPMKVMAVEQIAS